MHKVESAYLGDLPYSADAVRPNKAEQAKGRLTIWQKSDRLIVAMKRVKARGAKGTAQQRYQEVNHDGD